MAEDHNTYRRRRHREIGYGRWQPWADPEPVRDHVRQLRAHGASYRAIAAAAGVPAMAVHALDHGGGQVKAETADALMGVTPERLDLARVPATGTARRLRALIAAGHSQERISQALGCHPDTVRHLVRGTAATVSPDLRADAHRLYDAWWDRRPPERTREERMAAEAARRRAERAGWCTGAGLDDEHIEEPGYVPQASWRRAAGTGPAPEDPLGRRQPEPPVQLAGRRREARAEPRGAQMAPLPALLPDGRPYVPESEGLRPHLARREQGRYPHLEEEMQENEAGTWLAREEDGRVLEVNAAGYPGAEASPDDGRAVAEAETGTNLARQLERKAIEHLLNRPGAESIAPAAGGRDAAWMESYQAKVAELQQQNREYLADRAQDLAGELEAEAG